MTFCGSEFKPKDPSLYCDPSKSDSRNLKGINLTKKYWWPCMDKDIAEFLQNCGTCQKTKISRNSPNLLTPS
jgi:hypothetical protein